MSRKQKSTPGKAAQLVFPAVQTTTPRIPRSPSRARTRSEKSPSTLGARARLQFPGGPAAPETRSSTTCCHSIRGPDGHPARPSGVEAGCSAVPPTAGTLWWSVTGGGGSSGPQPSPCRSGSRPCPRGARTACGTSTRVRARAACSARGATLALCGDGGSHGRDRQHPPGHLRGGRE